MKMICELPSIAIPRTRLRVVWTFGVTMDTFVPTMAFISVDLPAFGAPISATNPALVPPDCQPCPVPLSIDPCEKFRRRHLFRLLARAGRGLDLVEPVNRNSIGHFRRVVRTGTGDKPVARQGKATPHGKFLKLRFCVLLRLRRRPGIQRPARP